MNSRGWVGNRLGGWVAGLAAIALGTACLAPAMRAEDTGRAVRLSYVEGQVRIAQGGELLADPALQNTPLFEGTQVLTADDGKAELQFDDGSVVRLSPNSSLTLAVLRGQAGSGDTEIELASGLSYLELQGGDSGRHIKVRFGDSVVTADGFTVMRIDVDNPPGELAVFSGNAHLERGSGAALDLHGGESVTLNAADPAGAIVAESIEPNSWDTWNSDRDQELSAMAAERTGAQDSLPDQSNPAWNDLNASGNWYNVPGTGAVWSPLDASNPGWDPYGNGYWMWTPRFGYIWVSGESWGYMPFQCGAWNFYNDFGWGWAPGMCQPWWGGGGWGFNIGYAPGRYRPPERPHPVRSHGHLGRPPRGGFLASPNAVVAVDRRSPSGAKAMPIRERNTIVTIGGQHVEALRPVSPRPQFVRPATGQMNHSQPGPTRPAQPGFTRPAQPGFARPAQPDFRRPEQPTGQRPATGFNPGGSHPVYAPPARSTPPARNSPGSQNAAPPSRPSSGGGAPPSRPSGGGGGGGSRPSGGGGGQSGGGGRH